MIQQLLTILNKIIKEIYTAILSSKESVILQTLKISIHKKTHKIDTDAKNLISNLSKLYIRNKSEFEKIKGILNIFWKKKKWEKDNTIISKNLKSFIYGLQKESIDYFTSNNCLSNKLNN